MWQTSVAPDRKVKSWRGCQLIPDKFSDGVDSPQRWANISESSCKVREIGPAVFAYKYLANVANGTRAGKFPSPALTKAVGSNAKQNCRARKFYSFDPHRLNISAWRLDKTATAHRW